MNLDARLGKCFANQYSRAVRVLYNQMEFVAESIAVFDQVSKVRLKMFALGRQFQQPVRIAAAQFGRRCSGDNTAILHKGDAGAQIGLIHIGRGDKDGGALLV